MHHFFGKLATVAAMIAVPRMKTPSAKAMSPVAWLCCDVHG
jgi:hypothetical protein